MRLLRICAVAAALALALPAAPATAASALDLVGLAASASADGPSQQTSVTVTANLEQQQYANISYEVTLQGFKVTKPIPLSSSCPASAVTVTVPAGGSVYQCSLSQQGTNAQLFLAIQGTFAQGPIAVIINKGSVMTPRPPGQYAVSVSSWAFDTESVNLSFSAQSYNSCVGLRKDYPTGVSLNVGAQRRAVAAGYRAPLVNPGVFLANRPLAGAKTGTVCATR
jgi:hypothetical protein